MIDFENVCKFYRIKKHTKVVLDHVSLRFDAGRSYAILGVNGAGKSTLVRLIAGTELPNGGRIRRSVRVSWPLGFAGGLHPKMTGRENIYFVARIYGQDPRRVLEFVEDFAEIGPYIDAPVGIYSSGMGQRVAFGQIEHGIDPAGLRLCHRRILSHRRLGAFQKHFATPIACPAVAARAPVRPCFREQRRGPSISDLPKVS